MNTATTTKTAAASTPTAEPAASQAAAETKGAQTGDVTAADVAAALGLPPEGQETDADDESGASETDDEGAGDEQGSDAEGSETESDGDEDAGDESDDESGESDDDEGEGESSEDSGESDTDEDNGEESGESDDEQPDKGEDDADEPGDDAKGKHGLQQRIDQLTAEKKTAQTEAAQLREKLATYEAQASGSLEPGALDAVDDPAQLATLRSRYVNLHKWALANPNGGKMPDGKGGEVEFDADEVARINAQTFSLLNEAIPQREQWIAENARANKDAEAHYSWLKDVANGEGLAVQKAIESIPFIRRLPSYRLVAANAYVGEKLRRAGIRVDDALIARLQKEQGVKKPGAETPASNGKGAPAARKPAAPPPRAPAAPARPGTLPRRDKSAAESRAAERRLNESSGSVDDIAASIASKLTPKRRR